MSRSAVCETNVAHDHDPRHTDEPFPVEFAGWLPVFARFGNCGTHPLFHHTQSPPPGYWFTTSKPAEQLGTNPGRLVRAFAAAWLTLATFATSCRRHGVFRTLATLFAFLRAFAYLARKTGRVVPALRFLHTRHFQSQVQAPRDAGLIFLTSVPFTFGQRPWVIEIEDSTSLFFPFVQNGHTTNADLAASPYFAMVRAMLEADACRGIITHMRSTAESLPVLFRSEAIARKVTYAPLGVRLPERFQSHDSDDNVNLLFTNSWHQDPNSFYLRGGLDVLEAFWVLHARYPQVRLTLRSALPDLDEHYLRIIQDGWVRVIDKFAPPERMDELNRESHVFLLPAARIHVVSVLQAMAYGQGVVVSDGWGMSEYVTHGETGVVIPGRAGKVSWIEQGTGVLREDYRPMYAADPEVVERLVAAVSELIEDRALRKRLGGNAREAVATRFTPERWNATLATAFDRARGHRDR